MNAQGQFHADESAPAKCQADAGAADGILANIATATALTAQVLAAAAEDAETSDDDDVLVGLI